MKIPKLNKALTWLKENPYIVLLALAGLTLLLLPTGEKNAESEKRAEESTDSIAVPGFSLEEEEKRLRKVLESIEGAGKTEVLLSLKSTVKRDIASYEGEAVIVSAGSGKQQAVENGYEYPSYLGAVVVCQGADDAAVKLRIYDAVSAFTGLGTSRIQVLKMDQER